MKRLEAKGRISEVRSPLAPNAQVLHRNAFDSPRSVATRDDGTRVAVYDAEKSETAK